MIGWMQSTPKALRRYRELYTTTHGMPLLQVTPTARHVLQPLEGRALAHSIIATLTQPDMAQRKLIVHGFSIGGYVRQQCGTTHTPQPTRLTGSVLLPRALLCPRQVYSHMLRLFKEDRALHDAVGRRIAGVVFDSPVDYVGSCEQSG